MFLDRLRESGVGSCSSLDLNVRRQFRRSLHRLLGGKLFKFDIAALQNRDHLWIETHTSLGCHLGHSLIERQRLAILPVRGKSVEAIDRGENACSDRNLFSCESQWISTAIPFFVMRPHDWYDRVRKVHLL